VAGRIGFGFGKLFGGPRALLGPDPQVVIDRPSATMFAMPTFAP